MTEPNPYTDGEYKWGPAQQPGPPRHTPGTPEYDFPQPTLAEGHSMSPPPSHAYADTSPNYVPAPMSSANAGGPPLLAIGDITVSGDTIITPAGTMPLKGAVWNATDMSRTEEKIPTHAIVLAIIFGLLCLVGLFFLLMKEKRTTGFIQVMVTSAGKHHSTMVPAVGPDSFQMLMGQINYARSLSSM
ncbi:hypothetical protein AB0O07_23890 [Streptomyces sp. NPDC093085]|uniref:hypothetical protein n=1 Tax=Streptomyces sp. NPDC093085 TaxID=3155068 RepID=UPI00341A2622